MKELALFAGIGGGLIASRILGWETVCAVEIDDYCQKVLKARQADGLLEPFPIYPDVRSFTIDTLRSLLHNQYTIRPGIKPEEKGVEEPIVDIVSGGFP